MIDIKELKVDLLVIGAQATGERLKEEVSSMTEFGNMVKAIIELERLQKKEVAMKPINKGYYESTDFAGNTYRKGHPYYEEEEREFVDKFHCPICDYNFWDYSGKTYNYCPRCGQKLDWSDE